MKILVIGVGGTMVSNMTDRGISPSMTTEEIFERTLGDKLPTGTELNFLNLMNIDSSLMRPEDWVKISNVIYENYEDFDAFLVLHGKEDHSR